MVVALVEVLAALVIEPGVQVVEQEEQEACRHGAKPLEVHPLAAETEETAALEEAVVVVDTAMMAMVVHHPPPPPDTAPACRTTTRAFASRAGIDRVRGKRKRNSSTRKHRTS